ncbi:MAG: OadG family protein [Clostridia bacterium]|nr:OadG family protein [Clostridia bacterium]
MMNTVFALASDVMSWSERASTAGSVTLQGMLVIFAVLAILWAAVEIMHALLAKDDSKVSEQKPSEQKAPVATADNSDAAIAAAIAAALAASEDDGATVAAITAAITAARAEEGNQAPFRVVSFKRAASANSKRKF